MTKGSDDQHTCREILKVSRRCDVGDRIVAYPQIEAQVRADTGDHRRKSGIVPNTADYVVRDSANEDLSQMNGGQFYASGLLRGSICDVDQFVSQDAHTAGRASRKHDDAVALYRVQYVLLNLCRDKKGLDCDSISLQTLKAIATHNDWSQGD